MPRAATLTATSRKKAVRSVKANGRARRPALKLVPARKPASAARTATATRPAPARPAAARPVAVRTVPARTTAAVKAAAPAAITYNKNDLLKRFAPLVRHVVERVAATLPRNVDHEDLYSAGVLGLLD